MALAVNTGTRLALSPAEYLAFREIVDNYDAAPLASRDDAEAAAWALGASYGPLAWVPASRDRRAFYAGAQDVVDADGFATAEGRSFRLHVSPGTVGLRSVDAAREAKRIERERCDSTASMLALYVDDAGAIGLPEKKPARVIAYWSARSRARMFTTVPQIDFSEWGAEYGALAMVTLTLPGDWLTLAPTGSQFKALLFAFRKRLDRAGIDTRGLWKLEFQKRGAPHVHLLLRVPALVRGEQFERWLSRTWAEVCGADDVWCQTCGGTSPAAPFDSDMPCSCEVPDTERARHLGAGTGVDYSGQRFSDPRRIATYFLGHSSKHADGKEYQHIVPQPWRADGAGPGRFWGYWGLKKGTVEVDLDQREWYAVRRMLRKVAKARAWVSYQQAVQRAADMASRGQTPREVRRPRALRSMRTSIRGGVVVVNDGIALAYDLGRALAIMRDG